MTTFLLFLAVALLAYSNGANDNFKGVASLYGSRTCSFKTALVWATITTALGSLAAIQLATGLLKNFSGKGLVLESLTQMPTFMLSVACAAGCTVLLATRLGFPISTPHGLTGALLGAGLSASFSDVNFAILGKKFPHPIVDQPAAGDGGGWGGVPGVPWVEKDDRGHRRILCGPRE